MHSSLSAHLLLISLLFFIAFFPSPSLSHGYLSMPIARTTTDPTVHSGPCGTTTPQAYPQLNATVGSPVNIEWIIQADHKGTVSLYVDYTGTGNKAFHQIAGPVSNTNPTSATVTFTQSCELCTVLWIWNSTEVVPYFGCSDIKIQDVSGGDGGGDGGDGGDGGGLTGGQTAGVVIGVLIGFTLLLVVVAAIIAGVVLLSQEKYREKVKAMIPF